MNKLLDEAFEIVAGRRALSTLQRDHKHGIIGKKHTFAAPGDFTPGRYEDLSKGYHRGSFIINERKEVFMCVDETEKEANWIILGSLEELATSESFVRKAKKEEAATTNGVQEKVLEEEKTTIPTEATPENSPVENVLDKSSGTDIEDSAPAPDEKEEKDPSTQEPVKENDDGSMSIGIEGGPNKSKTAIPDDMPYAGTLTKQTGLQYLEQVEKHAEEGTLADLSYISKDRAAKIKEYLEG